ncbi:MAG TPA: hypothetical protein VHZ96_21140 [Frankiaceae bacterium]|jgi:hypothetical protein|nr:hypothetical protein [Frankiaceae bacterium]
MPHANETGAEPGSRAGYAKAAAALVGLQGAGLIAAGGYLIVRALEPDAAHRASTEVLGALSLVVGLVIVATARLVRARRHRVRSPLLVLEIICVPIAITTIQGGRWYVGVPLAVVAVAVIVLMGLAGLLVPADE